MEGEKDIETLPEDESWVFESLVNFLHGPLWKLPVSGFIEEKSVVFDPESYNETLSEERELEFKKIHEEYKALVDFMLGSFMEDLEVTPEQVEQACRTRTSNGQGQQDSQLTKAALLQLSAAEDMDTFRRLMTRKNIDLQLQSLELLVSKYGELSPALRSSDSGDDPADDDFLQLVLRYTEEAAALDLEEEALHAPPLHNPPPNLGGARYTDKSMSQMQTSDSGEFDNMILSNLTIGHGKKALVEAVVEAEATPPGSVPGSATSTKSEFVDLKTVEEIKETASEQRELLASVRWALDETQNPLEFRNMKPKVTALDSASAASGAPVTEEDIQRRREYMRNQRDKLVALKKKERARLMTDNAAASRPKSAKAAAIALTTTPKATATEKSLAARKALADRLKQELQSK